MSSGASIATLLPLFMAVAMIRAERRIHRQLVDAGALTPESAVPLSLSRSMDSRRLQHLIRRGAVRVAANGHYYLDVEGWSKHLSNRKRRVLIAVSVIAVVLVGIAAAVVWLKR